MRPSLRALSSASASNRGLPPLPPVRTFRDYFKRTAYPPPPDPLIREFRGRILLASRSLCDEFVKSLKLREGEVVIEAWPGHGQLTRALLAGGNREVSAPWTKDDIAAASKAASTPPMPAVAKGKTYLTPTQIARYKLAEKPFPEWSEMLLADRTSEDRSGENQATDLPRPALVVTAESSPVLNAKALGLPPSELLGDIKEQGVIEAKGGEYEPPIKVFQSHHEPRLAISPHTVYRWSTVPAIMSNALVQKHLEEYRDESGKQYPDKRRPWTAPPPKLTFTAHIPASVVGEQLVSQWVGSVVGDAEGNRSWIWQWGRVRLALLVGKGLYDRITSQPRESINCKLSTLTRALFDITPLPPYHHVSNIDKAMTKIDHRAMHDGSPGPAPLTDERTTTYAHDFYPIVVKRGVISDDEPLSRPHLLGIMLTPKKDPVITIDQKDNWDYVLRNCFAREAMPMKVALKSLGFGAENLLPRIEAEEGGQWKGSKVDGDKIVRDLDVDEWLRVVDVFDKWAFKPHNLILDRMTDDFTREIGQD